jgi:hypothetical protein
MSSKHSYARSEGATKKVVLEEREKTENRERGRAERGEGQGERRANIKQYTGDRRGDPSGTRGEGKERRGEER